MKIIFTLLYICCFLGSYGQNSQFNCLLLAEIVNSMDIQKKKIETYRKIDGKYDLFESRGKYFVKIKKRYHEDTAVQRILKLPNIIDIVNVKDDSMFFLCDDIVLIDTFNFFTPECSCKFACKKISVVNDLNRILPDQKVINLISLDNYRGYSCISLKYNGSYKKIRRVIFLYLIEHNLPIIKDIDVIVNYNIK